MNTLPQKPQDVRGQVVPAREFPVNEGSGTDRIHDVSPESAGLTLFMKREPVPWTRERNRAELQ
jgi:hypothetical protein